MLSAISSETGALGLQLIWTVGVLAFLGIGAWLFNRFAAPRLNHLRSSRRMRIIEKLPLETGRALYLVQIDDRTMVVGVCAGAITPVADVACGEQLPRRQPETSLSSTCEEP